MTIMNRRGFAKLVAALFAGRALKPAVSMPPLSPWPAASMSFTVDPDGGYLVPPEFAHRLIRSTITVEANGAATFQIEGSKDGEHWQDVVDRHARRRELMLLYGTGDRDPRGIAAGLFDA